MGLPLQEPSTYEDIAMPVGVNDIIELTFLGEAVGQVTMSVLHYRVKVAPSVNDFIDAQEEFLEEVQWGGDHDLVTGYLAMQAENFDLKQLRAQWVSPQRIRPSYLAQVFVGNVDSNMLTGNVAGVITKQTDLAGRRYVGSVHVPGIATGSIANGEMTAGWRANADLWAASLTEEVNETGGTGVYEPVIYHRGFAHGQNGTLVTNAFAQLTTRVMRRRTVGVGI